MSGDEPLDWGRVNEVFHDALERPSEERQLFVESACGKDDGLRREVASLLEAHEHAGSLLEPPGAPGDDGDVLPRGATVGHYRVIDVLGEGGMGVVYLAEDTRLGRAIALKALPGRFTTDATRRERLRREARAAAALSHPGIAVVFALEEIDGHLYMASEHVPGETLRSELSRAPMTPARAIAAGSALAHALAAAHQRGVVHRDLKPENVIRTPAGDLKILDFGIARSLRDESARSRLTGDDALLGTPSYMSPEQIRGEETDARADVFSLGTLLYEAVTGANPFAGTDAASSIVRVLEADPAPLPIPPTATPSDIDVIHRLESVLRICLSKTPAGRYASAEELARAFDGAPPEKPAPRDVAPGIGASRSTAVWWWQFHQAAACAGYLALLVPLWLARQEAGTLTGLLVFLAALIGALGASLLRLHVWFATRSLPNEAGPQRARARPWIRLADLTLTSGLTAAGLLMLTANATLATVLVACAVGVVVAFAIVEPATTRAAFGS